MTIFTLILIAVLFAWFVRSWAIGVYKISYYETKLENNNIDISSVKDIGLIDIIRK